MRDKYLKLISAAFAVISLLMCHGCHTSRTETEIKQLSGKQIQFPETYEMIKSRNVPGYDDPLNKRLKIVTYIDENMCSLCAMRILVDWQLFLKDMERDVGFVAIAFSGDKEALESALTELDICLPVLYDINNTFLSLNRLGHIRARCRTFLLDGQNRVILVGEPLNSPRLKTLYKTTIKSLYEEL